MSGLSLSELGIFNALIGGIMPYRFVLLRFDWEWGLQLSRC